nr:MAG TPA: hypothetical protein [Caudoviricetes sp.]
MIKIYFPVIPVKYQDEYNPLSEINNSVPPRSNDSLYRSSLSIYKITFHSCVL